MPKLVKLKDKDGGYYTLVSLYDDVIEKEDPLIWFGSLAFLQLTQMGGVPEDDARKLSFIMLNEWINAPCPSFLMDILDTTRKRDQEGLLRGQQVTPDNLITWSLIAGARGAKFSQYGYDGGSGDLKGRAPVMIDASDPNHIKTIGNTELSDAALNYIVERQNKVLAQFIDFDDGRWYCFYRTHRGLAGREPGSHGQHLHFVSSAYGLDRNTLRENFRKGICPGNGFHVHLAGYHEEDVHR